MNILKKNLFELMVFKDRNIFNRIIIIYEYIIGKKNGIGGYV